MNSRSSVNEKNLVEYSTELSTLNPLETKESLLSFPFDHLYACHSETSDQRQTPQLDKEIEISTHCVEDDKELLGSSTEVCRLSEQLTAFEKQNKKLKELLIYHLDLIQQQNELITKRDKVYQSLKQENDTLKTKLSRMTRSVAYNPKHTTISPPVVQVPTPSPTATVIKGEQTQIKFHTYKDLLLAETGMNSYIFPSELKKTTQPFDKDTFEAGRSTDVPNYFSTDLISSIPETPPQTESYNMIEKKRTYIKKEIKSEPRSDPLYSVTANSGQSVIPKVQRSRRRSSAVGRTSRSRATPKPKNPDSTNCFFEDDESFEKIYSISKKSKMINTYGKSKLASLKRTSQFTGSLSDRLRLIDTTPTGEDPYQLGEADMREQSPIPKLMLQKTNQGRMKVRGDGYTETNATRRIYDVPATDTSKQKLSSYSMSSTYTRTAQVKPEPKTMIVEEPDLDIVKTEPEIDWRVYSRKSANATSLCDFSYGENSHNLTSTYFPVLDSTEIQDLLDESPHDLFKQRGRLSAMEFGIAAPVEKNTINQSKRRATRKASSVGSGLIGAGDPMDHKRTQNATKRGRKRASSTTGLVKNIKQEKGLGNTAKPKGNKTRTANRGKKSPVPGMETNDPYHTLMGDPDLSWYLGLDPDVKFDDIDPIDDCKESTVEVPMWREMPYTSSFTIEDAENLDDRVFEKRHQKLEAEERRQLRWHMRRIREQRHVEKLRQRQRHSWCRGGASQHPLVFTIWPQPQRDVRAIEITDTLPVIAFGESLPALPETDFMLPWVRISKALKRAKRSKTLH